MADTEEVKDGQNEDFPKEKPLIVKILSFAIIGIVCVVIGYFAGHMGSKNYKNSSFEAEGSSAKSQISMENNRNKASYQKWMLSDKDSLKLNLKKDVNTNRSSIIEIMLQISWDGEDISSIPFMGKKSPQEYLDNNKGKIEEILTIYFGTQSPESVKFEYIDRVKSDLLKKIRDILPSDCAPIKEITFSKYAIH
jgi:flagellar basal body-associated protein FliL